MVAAFDGYDELPQYIMGLKSFIWIKSVRNTIQKVICSNSCQSLNGAGMEQYTSNITVIIPAFNAGRVLVRALDSVLRQTVQPTEVIVVNDGSIDDTQLVAETYAVHHRLPLRVLSKSNGGVSSARNLGIQSALTEHVALLDADDEFGSMHIESVTAAIAVRPDAPLYWTGIARQFDAGGEAEAGSLPDFSAIARRHVAGDPGDGIYDALPSAFDELLKGSYIPTSASVFKRLCNGRLNLFDEQLHFGEDRLFYLQLLERGGVFVDRVTAIIHRDGSNASATGGMQQNCLSRMNAESQLLKGRGCYRPSRLIPCVLVCLRSVCVRRYEIVSITPRSMGFGRRWMLCCTPASLLISAW